MIYQSFSNRQKLAIGWWKMPHFKNLDGIICDGSVRSGKTLSMSVGFVLWSLSAFNHQRFAICGKTIESVRRNVTDLLSDWLGGIVNIQEKRSENKFVISANGHSNTYFVFGGKDESSYQLIQGITLAGVLLDEVALMPESFVSQATARCSINNSKIWFNCNPQSPQHWFYTKWIQNSKSRNLLYLHFTMDDNPSLSSSIIQRYQSLYSGVFFDRYIRGLWVAAEGLIYDCFDKSHHVISDFKTNGKCFISVDYGTRNPTVFLLWQQEVQSNRWICIKEYYWDGRKNQRQKTDGEYADDLMKLFSGLYLQMVIVDPSAASFITELRNRKLPVVQANNSVVDGIRVVSEFLRNDKIAFSTDCVNTVREFQLYSWDSSAQGCDKPVKDNDHAMDAIRYFVYSVLYRSTVSAKKRPNML